MAFLLVFSLIVGALWGAFWFEEWHYFRYATGRHRRP